MAHGGTSPPLMIASSSGWSSLPAVNLFTSAVAAALGSVLLLAVSAAKKWTGPQIA